MHTSGSPPPHNQYTMTVVAGCVVESTFARMSSVIGFIALRVDERIVSRLSEIRTAISDVNLVAGLLEGERAETSSATLFVGWEIYIVLCS